MKGNHHMLKIHSLVGVSPNVGFVRGCMLMGGTHKHLASLRGEHALSSSEFLACARRMAAELDAHPPPERETTGQRLTAAVRAQLAPPTRARLNAQLPSEYDPASEQLRRAVKALLPKRAPARERKGQHTAMNADETFADKLKRIAKARANRKGVPPLVS